jgi:hypothetical protein
MVGYLTVAFLTSQLCPQYCTLIVCLPSDRSLPGRRKSMPYVVVANEAFPLKNYLMKPYSGRTTDSVIGEFTTIG